MRLINSLQSEHHLLVEALARLEAAALCLDQGAQLPWRRIEALLEFIHAFGERYHIAKEELVLFPALDDVDLQALGFTIDDLIDEHDRGRRLLRSLMSRAPKRTCARDARDWAGRAFDYIRSTCTNICREDLLFFLLLADGVIEDNDRARLDEAMRTFENGLSEPFYQHIWDLSRELCHAPLAALVFDVSPAIAQLWRTAQDSAMAEAAPEPGRVALPMARG